MYTKNMLVGIALGAVMAVAPVLAADKSADLNALRSDSRALSPDQGRSEPLPLSTEQMDSVKGGGGDTNCNGALNCTPVLSCLVNANILGVLGSNGNQTCGRGG